MGPADKLDPVEQMLRAANQKQSTVHQVFRRLVSYPDWIVPALLMNEYYGREDSPGPIAIFGTEGRYREKVLWLFSGFGAASRAESAGGQPGVCATGIRGTDLFAKFNPSLKAVFVNPGSPLELTWSIERDHFNIATAWAEVITFEQSILEARSRGPALGLEVLQGYKGFLCLLHAANNGAVTLTSHPGLRNAAVVFTAPDCLDAFLARVSPEQRPGLRTESIYFTDWELLRTEWPDIDGVVLNPVGPGPVAVFGL